MTGHSPVFLDVILRPSPPLSPRALVVVLAVVAAANFLFGMLFAMEGAWPVMPFMGLDVAFLAWALLKARRAARAHEHLVLTQDWLTITRVAQSGEAREERLNPYWLNVRLEEEVEEVRHLYLSSHGRSTEIGYFLPPEERIVLAGRLKAALHAARSWRP